MGFSFGEVRYCGFEIFVATESALRNTQPAAARIRTLQGEDGILLVQDQDEIVRRGSDKVNTAETSIGRNIIDLPTNLIKLIGQPSPLRQIRRILVKPRYCKRRN